MPMSPHPRSPRQHLQNVVRPGAHVAAISPRTDSAARPAALFLTWRDGWKTGIVWVDRDHQDIARLINRLADACAGELSGPDEDDPAPRSTPATRIGALDDLIDRMREHFDAEEKLLRAIDYPSLQAHSCEHAMQLAELSEVRRDLLKDGSLCPETLQGIKRWFLEHAIAEDSHYASFYHRRLAAVGPRAQTLAG